MRRPELKIPTLLGIFLSLIGMGAGVWFLHEPIRTAVFADAQETPIEIVVSNITDSSFTVSWITTKATPGYIQYSRLGEGTQQVISDDRDQEQGSVNSYFTHLVTIRGLSAQTVYEFKIGSGSRMFDQNGQSYRVSTGPSLGTAPEADVAYGQVITPNGEPADGALVYLSLPGAIVQAALVKPSGSWVVPVSIARTSDLSSFISYDPQSTQIQIQVKSGSLGTASVVTTTGQDSPVPVITLGQTYNYLSENASISDLVTESVETNQEGLSRFSLDSLSPATESADRLTILSPRFGEEVNSATPQIIGRGPANSQVTITIESETVITDTVRTNSAGNFSYSVPQDLEPGEHTITITTIVDGIAQKVQRKFVVLAAEDSNIPAFTATPSAVLSPTPTPTPTPTLAPRVTIPSTASGVPTSGNLAPTALILLFAFGLMAGGAFLFKRLA